MRLLLLRGLRIVHYLHLHFAKLKVFPTFLESHFLFACSNCSPVGYCRGAKVAEGVQVFVCVYHSVCVYVCVFVCASLCCALKQKSTQEAQKPQCSALAQHDCQGA